MRHATPSWRSSRKIATAISTKLAQTSWAVRHPVSILSMSALIKVRAAVGSAAVMLISVALWYSIDMSCPRAMVMARNVRCWY